MKIAKRFSLPGAALLALAAAGCEETMATHGTDPSMSISATRSEMLVNESATVLVKSSNTLGTHPSVNWSASMGKITPVKEGALDFRSDKPSAIFTSDKPGVAVITATLHMSDGRVLSDTTQINVKPLP